MKYFTILIIAVVCINGIYSAANCGPNGDANCQIRCQNTSLTSAAPTQTATACIDTRSDCELLFNCTDCDDPSAYTAFVATDPATNPKYRHSACDIPSMSDIALECARTCLLCCETAEYNCEDDDTGRINCDANRGKCTDSAWTDIMSQYCPATCGLCANGTCTDLNSGCNGLRPLCRDVDFYDYMGTNCARTCERCSTSTTTTTSSSCSDIASNCAVNSYLCTNSVYRTLMTQQCCATCSGTSVSSTCSNNNSNCANWVRNGFCSSTFYTTAQKRQYCARSCNLC